MNTRSYLGLSFATAVCGLAAFACEEGSDSSDMDASVPSVSVSTSGLPADTMTMVTGTTPTAQPTNANVPPPPATTATATGGTGGSGGSDGSGGTGEGGGGSPTVAAGGTCEVSSLSVFSRSDTAEPWDDNDFSDVTVETGCPVLVNATWPHEVDWQGADPSEANYEQVHFTLDSSMGGDLSGKQLNLTIELADSPFGPTATAGGYLVSLVSVSTYDKITVVEPVVESSVDAGVLDGGVSDAATPLTEAGSDIGSSDTGDTGDDTLSSSDAIGSDASSSTVSDGGIALLDGGDASAPTEEPPMTVTSTGYSEAESLPEDRLTLRHVGDRATVTFALPSKTAEVDSFDPSRVIKINIRIYNMFVGPETTPTPTTDVTDAGSSSEPAPAEADASLPLLDGGSSALVAVTDLDAAVTLPVIDASAPDVVATPATPARVYSYLNARFAITNFTVSDVTGL